MSKIKLYLLVITATLLGLAWVVFNFTHPYGIQAPELCLFKRATGIPCPSCGSTHAVMCIAHLDLKGAWHENPLGFVIALALLVLPAWILYDIANNKSTFYYFYDRTERYISRRWVAIPLALLVAANWIWSIYKYAA
jgi:hypothetical protein